MLLTTIKYSYLRCCVALRDETERPARPGARLTMWNSSHRKELAVQNLYFGNMKKIDEYVLVEMESASKTQHTVNHIS